tara:strand:- start:892 stop:1479 length:588 start_codon:yes stop_codon:yes gene_type:complete
MNPHEKLGLRLVTDLASIECNRSEDLRRILRDVVHDLTTLQDNAAPISFGNAALVNERDEWRRKCAELKGERLSLESENQELRAELKAIREAGGAQLRFDDGPPLAEAVGRMTQRLISRDIDNKHQNERIAELTQKLEALTPEPWRTVAEEAPPVGVQLMVISQNGWSHCALLSTGECLDWVRHWRRIPRKLLES